MRPRIRVFCAISLVLFLLVLGSAALESQVTAIAAMPAVRPTSKLSARLEMLAVSSALRAASVVDQSDSLSLAASGPGSLMRDPQGRILVEIRSGDTSPAFQQTLRDLGAEIVAVSERYESVAAYVGLSDLRALADLKPVKNVQETLAPVTGGMGQAPEVSTCPRGISTTEGFTQTRANLAAVNYGLGGAGVKVGMLSDSYDRKVSAATHAAGDVSSGDLPGATNTCGTITAVSVISDTYASGADEGRAMLQIVHDIAPTSTLSFATASVSEIGFANNIRALKADGAQIIGDDVIYFDEPLFQDGIVSVAISDVVRTGALYFALAHNFNIIDGGKNIASNEAPAYRPTACPAAVTADGELDCHDFNPGAGVQNSLDFTLSNVGVTPIVSLQYAEPWYGVTTDLDLYILDSSNSIIYSSTNNNLTSDKPFEVVGISPVLHPGALHLVVARYTGGGGDTLTPRLKVTFYTNCNCAISGMSPNTGTNGDIVGPALTGHSATHDAIVIAAAPYYDDTTPEGFSGHGPAAHYFGPVANTTPAAAIAQDIINQPDITATDGGCNTFFGSVSAGCHRFFGTSAATPHAAAVAALLKQKATASGIRFNQEIARLVLKASARPMSGGTPASVGAGFIDANAAVAKLLALKFLFLPLIRR